MFIIASTRYCPVFRFIQRWTVKVRLACYCRCLQDNDWDFDRAAQIFTGLKVRQCPFLMVDGKSSRTKDHVSCIHLTRVSFLLQAQGKIPDVAFVK